MRPLPPWTSRVALGATAILLALTGSCVAANRLDARLRNPDGIPISRAHGHLVPGGSLELLTSRSPGGAFSTVMRVPATGSDDATLLVVDAATGSVVGGLPGTAVRGQFSDHGWRDPTTLWVSVADIPAGCAAAYVARAPAWSFVVDDCSRPPPDAGTTVLRQRAPSPDGVLLATARYDRSGPWDFGDAATPVPDVRLEDVDGRFLAQLGNVELVGWTPDGTLIVVSDSDHRPYAIARPEIDRIVTGG